MSSSQSSTSTATPVAIGVAVGVVVLLALAGLGFWIWRRRSQAVSEPAAHSTHRHTLSVVNPSHVASRITPFGSPAGEQPLFVHRPGENMRVAYRRSDGGWEFQEQNPEPPISPSPRFSMSANSMLSLPSTKERKMRLGDLTMRGYVELDGESNPPPAYHPPPSSRAETSFSQD